MKVSLLLLLFFIPIYESRLLKLHRRQDTVPSPSGKYRISPKTGVRIALPSRSTSYLISPLH